jgi:hypothetical protein
MKEEWMTKIIESHSTPQQEDTDEQQAQRLEEFLLDETKVKEA